jgi:hypothetical protein
MSNKHTKYSDLLDFSETTLFSKYDITAYGNLQGLMGPDGCAKLLIEAIEKVSLRPMDQFLVCDAFLDGDRLKLSKDFFSALKQKSDPLSALSEIQNSFRFTNVHKANSELQNIAIKIGKAFNCVVSVNLYFTPNGKSNCFDYHTDGTKIIILQLLGSKEWFFPLNEEDYLFSTKKTDINVQHDCEELLLTQGDCLYFARSIAHKALHRGTGPSIHLTFAVSTFSNYDLINKLQSFLENDKIISNNDFNTFEAKTNNKTLHGLFSDEAFENVFYHSVISSVDQEKILMLKNGRRYDVEMEEGDYEN